MALLSEDFPNRSTQSISVNEKIIDTCKQTGLPLSQVAESCLLYFARISDIDKIRILAENDPGKVDSSEIIPPSFDYGKKAVKEAKEKVGKNAFGLSTKALISIGIALLLVAILAAISNKEKT